MLIGVGLPRGVGLLADHAMVGKGAAAEGG